MQLNLEDTYQEEAAFSYVCARAEAIPVSLKTSKKTTTKQTGEKE